MCYNQFGFYSHISLGDLENCHPQQPPPLTGESMWFSTHVVVVWVMFTEKLRRKVVNFLLRKLKKLNLYNPLLTLLLTLTRYNSQTNNTNEGKLGDFSHMPIVSMWGHFWTCWIFFLLTHGTQEVMPSPAQPQKSVFLDQKGPKNKFYFKLDPKQVIFFSLFCRSKFKIWGETWFFFSMIWFENLQYE